MSRKLPILALVIVGLHVCEVLVLGTSPLGSLAANSLQIIACGLAAATALDAARRGRGSSQAFWLLFSMGMAAWGVANLGWMYYDNWLRQPVPQLSVVRFLFDSQGLFLAIALLLDKEGNSALFDLETLLDSVQVAVVFFSAFFGLYYVHVLRGGERGAATFMVWEFEIINVALTVLAGVQTATAHTRRMRLLFGGLALYLVLFLIFSGVTDYVQTIHNVPTGTWWDLGWTIPFLAAALWASRWKDVEEEVLAESVSARRAVPALAIKHIVQALGPLTVLFVVAQLGPEWRKMGFYLLGVSIACYAARLAVSEYRKGQTAEIAHRNTLAMDSAVNGIAIIEADGKHSYVNPSYARMMGLRGPESAVGKPWRQVYPPGNIEPVVDSIRQGLKEHGKWFGPLTMRHENGTVVPMEMEMAVTALPGGGMVCVSRDITQRLTAQRGWAEAEAKYRALIEHVSAVSYIAEVGVDGAWHYVSPQVETMFGFTVEEWMKDSTGWIRHVHTDDHPVIEAAERASERGDRFHVEYRVIRKDGGVIWVSDTAVVVAGRDAQPMMEGLIVDITERKQLEGQLQQARRMEAVGRLAGGIAHDFNNLLTIIKGYTELALTRVKAQPELRTDVERIEDAAERAATLVRQLLAFSRRQVLQPKVLDLNSIVVGLDKLLRRLMDEDIEMVTVASEGVGTIKADPGQIEQVIMNLVVNARDAMPSGGRLLVETANVDLDSAYASDHTSVRPGRYVMLAVTDTGTGMDADTVAHIFEPFYTTKESGRGTGLGLSTVYGIVKQSGGYIWVYSELGKGTAFKVYLPRVDEPAEAPSTSKTRRSDHKGSETILLVEDDPQVRELTRTVLASKGYFIVEAAGPEDAERICQSDRTEIHLLLTDVTMPGISGRELAKRLTARIPKLKVLYMSGYTFNVMATGGTLERGVAFLQKPFTPNVLVEKVREVLDGVASAR